MLGLSLRDFLCGSGFYKGRVLGLGFWVRSIHGSVGSLVCQGDRRGCGAFAICRDSEVTSLSPKPYKPCFATKILGRGFEEGAKEAGANPKSFNTSQWIGLWLFVVSINLRVDLNPRRLTLLYRGDLFISSLLNCLRNMVCAQERARASARARKGSNMSIYQNM